MWYVYLLTDPARRRTYIGATIDVRRRLRQHNGEICGGARATRACRPWTIVAYITIPDTPAGTEFGSQSDKSLPVNRRALKLEKYLKVQKNYRGPVRRGELFQKVAERNNFEITWG